MAWLTKRGSFFYIKFFSRRKEDNAVATGTESRSRSPKKNFGSSNRPKRGGTIRPFQRRFSIADVLTAYVEAHPRNEDSEESAQTDVYGSETPSALSATQLK